MPIQFYLLLSVLMFVIGIVGLILEQALILLAKKLTKESS